MAKKITIEGSDETPNAKYNYALDYDEGAPIAFLRTKPGAADMMQLTPKLAGELASDLLAFSQRGKKAVRTKKSKATPATPALDLAGGEGV